MVLTKGLTTHEKIRQLTTCGGKWVDWRQFVKRNFYKEELQDMLRDKELSPTGNVDELIDRLVEEAEYNIFHFFDEFDKNDVKGICEDNDLPVSGTKDDLVNRILEEVIEISEEELQRMGIKTKEEIESGTAEPIREPDRVADGIALTEFLRRCNFVTQADTVLLTVYCLTDVHPTSQETTAERVRNALRNSRIPEPRNILSILRLLEKKGFLKRKETEGSASWITTIFGEEHAREMIEPEPGAKVKEGGELRRLMDKVKDDDSNDFLKECLTCLEANALRSSVIMGWALVMDSLYHKVLNVGPSTFNKAAQQRYGTNAKTVRRRDDLLYYRDSNILLLCEDVGLFDRNIRDMLEGHLKLRNKCAHPGKYKLGKKKVEGFFEDVVNNVLL